MVCAGVDQVLLFPRISCMRGTALAGFNGARFPRWLDLLKRGCPYLLNRDLVVVVVATRSLFVLSRNVIGLAARPLIRETRFYPRPFILS